MPIYAYKCASCGYTQDVLMKVADAPLTQCPSCGAATFIKQLTAPGFQLKGSGWYATDFKGGVKPVTDDAKQESKVDAKPDTKSDSKSDAKPDSKTDTKDSKPTPAPAKVASSAASATPEATSGGKTAERK